MESMMDFEGEVITWEVVNNTVGKRMVNSSLVHRLVAKRKLKRRTRILNCLIKKMSVHSYSQYIKMKTSVLRNFPHDSDSDDNASFTDEDYQNIYKSEDSMRKYMDTSRKSVDLSCIEDTDDDYIILSQPDTSSMQPSLGWQRVIKKKRKLTNVQNKTGKSQTTGPQTAISHNRKDSEQNSTVEKRKKLVNKVGDRKSVSIQNSIKELFIAKQLSKDNDTLTNEKNAEDIPGTNLNSQCDWIDDVPLNERAKDVPIHRKHNTETTNTDNSKNKSSKRNIVSEILPINSMKQESSTEREPDKCTTNKHSDTIKKKSCELQEKMEDSDNDYIPPTQSDTSGIQDSLSKQKVIKKNNKLTKAQSKSGKYHTIELQKTTSHSKQDPDENSTTEKKKKLTKKISDKKSASTQNSSKVSFIAQQSGNDNDVLSNNNNAEDISDISLHYQSEEKDDVPLNERDINISSTNACEHGTKDYKQTVEITNTDKIECSSQIESSQDNIVNEVLPNDTMKQESSTKRKPDECTTEKDSDTIRERPCEVQEKAEDSDNDCIPPTQANTSKIQDSMDRQKVTKKNRKCHTTEMQKATSHTSTEPDETSAMEKKKKLTRKIGDKTSVTSQNSIKVPVSTEQLDNDSNVLSKENNPKEISDKYTQDDVPLNKRGTNDSSLNPSELRSTDVKTVQITNTANSQNNSSQDNIVEEVLPSNSINQESSKKKKPDECTTEKHSATRRGKSSKQEEKKEIQNSAAKETDENNKENRIEHVSKATTNEATENVKKNLMGVFNNFSVISGNKVSEMNDSNVNESMDMSKAQLRISDISPLCRSTPMPFGRTEPKIPKPVSQNQPKDSGIDEDSQEESLENGKAKDEEHKRILINTIPNTRILESSESDNSSESTDQPSMVIDEDITEEETDDGNELEHTLVSNSQVIEDEEPYKQKPQLKVTCTEIVNQKYKIITAKQLNEVKESKKECDHHQEKSNDHSKTEVSVADEQEDYQIQELPTKEQTKADHEEDSENPDEIMSATSTKKVQQLKRLDLTADLSSSEDENHTECKSQKVSQSSVRKDKTDDDSDEKDSTFVIKSQNLKNKCKSKKSTIKKQKSPEVIVACSSNSIEKKAKDIKKNQSVLSTAQNDESFSFSESGSETDTSRKTKSMSTHKSDKPKFETSILSKMDNHAQKDINNQAQKATPSKSRVIVGNGQTQTEVHIPPKVILKRPNNLQEYIKQEGELELIVDQLLTSFSSHDLSYNELFIMDIPKKVLNSELLGQNITLTKNKLKLGKRKYKAVHKDVESVTCVLKSGDVHKPFESVQLKPVAVVVTQARLDEEGSTIKLPEVVDSAPIKLSKLVDSKTSKYLPSTSGSVSKSVKRRSNGKSVQQQWPKAQFIKGIKKRKLSDSKSLEVFHKKEKKHKRELLYENES